MLLKRKLSAQKLLDSLSGNAVLQSNNFFSLFSGENYFHKSLTFELLYRAYGDAVSNIFMLMSTWLTVTMAFSRLVRFCQDWLKDSGHGETQK